MPTTTTFAGMIDDDNTTPEVEESAAPLAVYSTNTANFSPEDIAPPMIKLMQGLSPEVQEGAARPGNWVLSGFDPTEVLTMVPLSYARRREFRNEDTNAIDCRSWDGETGEGNPGGFCMGCPMNQWTGEGKSRKGPSCVFMYSYMMYVVEFDSVGVMNFKRTGLATGKVLNTIVARTGFGKTVIRATSKMNSSGKGSYYIPQVFQVTGVGVEEVLAKAAPYIH